METVALILVLTLAVVLIVAPAVAFGACIARKVRTLLHLRRMRQLWRAHNLRGSITGISRPFTAMMAATSLQAPTRAGR